MSRRQRLQELQSLSSGRAGKLPIIGGRACLDFVNTISGRGTADRRENLTGYFDLLAWSHRAGILSADDTLELAARARAAPAAARHAFSRALALREALYVIFDATAQGKSIPTSAVARLNKFLTEAAKVGGLEPAPSGQVWRWSTAGPARLDRPLWPIVRSAAELLMEGPLARLKTCDGIACGWMFLDQTRNGRRRWCEMEVCGSRAKMRRYRRRQRRNPGPSARRA